MAKNNNEELTKQYDYELQKFYMECLVSDPNSFSRCQAILKPDYFDSKLQRAVKYVLEFADEYQALPTTEQIKAETRIELQRQEGVSSDYLMDEIESFCRHQATYNVILEGAELHASGQYELIEGKLKDALTISLDKDMGTDYFADPKERLLRLRDKTDMFTTGWEAIDKPLYGGFTRGALNVFCGGSGTGKSLFLQNLALNWSRAGLDVVYITLELSEALVAQRLDAMLTGVPTKDFFKDLDNFSSKVQMKGKFEHKGKIFLKKMSEAGTTSNDIRAYLKELEIQRGIRPGAILVDYLDLMYPNNRRINPSDLFVKDKFVAEELRALATEYNVMFATASQLNRSAVEANGDFDHSHIAGGISKINTADNVFGIHQTAAMKERGEYILKVLKARSAACTGRSIELKYNPECMLISDPDPDADITEARDFTSIAKDIKQKSSVQPQTSTAPRIEAATTNSAPKASPNRANMLDILNRVKGK